MLLKMQVYELLSCLCMYSDEDYSGMGYRLSISALQHYKVTYYNSNSNTIIVVIIISLHICNNYVES